ncbi:MAG: SMC family ATPase [Dehalococcoidia bacterium]|nr:SMC family ATPase [Dehalococcoidia bacterium]
MKPTSIEIKGITSFQEKEVIDFAQLGNLFAVVGTNGSGKSSIFDAMTHALFGGRAKSGKDTGLNDLKSLPDASIRLKFEHRGNSYEIFRSAKPNQSYFRKLNVDNEWEILAERLEDEVTKAVESTIGLNLNLFNKTILIPQNKFDGLIAQDAKSRRATFSGLISGNIFEKMRDIAYSKEKELEDQLNTMQGALNVYIAQILKGENLEITSQIDIPIKELQKIKKQNEKDKKILQEEIQLLEDTKNGMIELNTGLMQKQQRETNIKQLKTNIGSLESDIKTLTGKETQDTKKYQLHKKELEKIQYVPNSKEALNHWQNKHDLEQNKAVIEKQLIVTNEIKLISELNKYILQADTEIENKIVTLSQIVNYIAVQVNTHTYIEEQLQNYLSIKQEIHTLSSKLKELEKANVNNEIASILAKLSVGDLCPVCGNKITTLKAHTKEQEISRDVYAEQKKRLEELNKKLYSIEEQLKQHIDNIHKASNEGLVKKIQESKNQYESLIPIGKQYKDFCETNKISILNVQLEEDVSLQLDEMSIMAHEAASRYSALQEFIKLSNQYHDLQSQISKQDIELGRYEEIIKKIKPKKSTIAEIINNLDKNEETYKNIQNKITDLEKTMKENQLTFQSKSGELKAIKKQFSDEEKQIQKDKEKIEIILNRINSDFTNKNDEVDKMLKTIKNPAAVTSGILNDKIDEVNQLLEARKEIEKENETKLDASETAIKIKQESAELESDYTLFQEVKESLNPSAFPEYVLNQVIENILLLSSAKLQILSPSIESMSQGETGQLMISDKGEERKVVTLSGGEKFICSLAMILGISEYISNLQDYEQHMSMESLIIDEGFGSLDEENLDIVIEALEEVAEDRMVAIISHVKDLEKRIPSIIKVKAGTTNKIEIL